MTGESRPRHHEDYAMETTRQAQAEAAGLRERLAEVTELCDVRLRQHPGDSLAALVRAAASPKVAP